MFNNFSFKKALTSTLDFGKDIFLGKEPEFYDAFGDKERSGGFLDLVGKGARAYTAMRDTRALLRGEDPDDLFQVPEHEVYTARNRFRQRGAQINTQRYSPTNRLYQDAILRRMKQVNFEKNLQRMTASTTVRPTAKRKAPVSPGKTTITRQTSAPSIRPANTTTTTV